MSDDGEGVGLFPFPAHIAKLLTLQAAIGDYDVSCTVDSQMLTRSVSRRAASSRKFSCHPPFLLLFLHIYMAWLVSYDDRYEPMTRQLMIGYQRSGHPQTQSSWYRNCTRYRPDPTKESAQDQGELSFSGIIE
jgi:hypothetical protein